MTQNEQDRQWMARALELATQSRGLASPNPAVGCVLTHGGRQVGEGFHQYDLLDHAEIVALGQAGDRARGATAYVTLEPCVHQGRSGPCADALVSAGVARVVIATADPNPLVSGRGISRLRQGGIEVSAGVLEAPARRLNDGFAKFIRSGLPFVTMKVASSLDGRIAPASAGPAKRGPAPSPWITGEETREEVHRMRHSSDALLVGVGTVLADDPRLTDRSRLPRRRRLLRVVLDSTLRTPLDSKLVTAADNDLLIVFTQGSPSSQRALEERGVRLERFAPEEGEAGVPLKQVLRNLAGREMASVLVEAGSKINASVLGQDLADKLVVFYGPLLLGPNAVPMLSSVPATPIIERFMLDRFGGDFAFEAYLHDPWKEVH